MPNKNPKHGQPYSPQEIDFIKANYQTMGDKELATALGRSAGSIQHQRQRNLGLMKFKMPADWSAQEIEIFKKYYPTSTKKEIKKLLPNRTMKAIYQRARVLGIGKTEEFLQAQNKKLAIKLSEKGKKYRFKKGHKSFNKGKKQNEYMSKEAINRSAKTRFKKGQIPHNTLYDGAITIREDSKGRPYVYLRLSAGEWELHQRVIWEREHGPIPDTHIIRFKDGNSMNVCLENLECITKAENLRINWESNREAALAGFKRYREEKGTPAERLTDNIVAGWITGHDKELQTYILEHHYELIEAARNNYKLNREIQKRINP